MPRLAIAALLALSLTRAVAVPTPDVSRPVADGVRLVPGAFVVGRQPDSNTVLFETPEGWVVVDTGRSEAHAQAVVAAIRASGKPLKSIVNSHWHLDHIGGNGPLMTAFGRVPVLASGAIVEARAGFLARYRQQLTDLLAKQPKDAVDRAGYEHEVALIDAREASTPSITIDRTATRRVAGKEFLVGLAAHAATAGDVWLYDPSTKTLASGDLVTLPAPLFDTACPAQWQRALDALERVPFATLVPGHGQPMDREGFAVYRKAYQHLVACGSTDADKQSCIARWMDDARPLIPPTDEALARTLLDYYLDHVLRDAAAPARAACPHA